MSPPSKTVRKGDNTPVPLPDELKRVLKMPKPEFVEYMVKNSTKKELVQLVLMLQSAEPKLQPTLPIDMQTCNNLTKEELSSIIYTRVRKRSCWTSNSISNMALGSIWLGILTPLATLKALKTDVGRAGIMGTLGIVGAIKIFMQVSKENAYTRKGNKVRATLFQRHLHRQLQKRISNKTHNSSWVKSLRNYFQTSKSTKSTSQTKKAARK
jgi:hypothetical protein